MKGLSFGPDAPRALVLLPGAQMSPEHVVQAGLPATLAQARSPLTLHVPDLHLDPTTGDAVTEALVHTVLRPLRRRHHELWLGGISLGGLLALRAAQREPDGLAGLCLLAPYTGSRLTHNALAQAGGLDAWQPSAAQQADPEFCLWHDLRAGRPDLPCFVGWGRDDRFAGAMRDLVARLPRAVAHEVDGGHDWSAWLPLWQRFLAGWR